MAIDLCLRVDTVVGNLSGIVGKLGVGCEGGGGGGGGGVA